MRIAVIGANSYIARNLIYTNSQYANSELRLFGYESDFIDQSGEYTQIDVMSLDDMKSAIRDCDLIYFFVGKTGTLQGFDIPETFLDVNEKSLLCLLNACRAVNPGVKIVFPSTRLVYAGSPNELQESAPNCFLTPYAIQKYACEQYLQMYYNMFQINYVILRICVPYGTLVHPVSSYGTIDFFLKQAKEQKRITLYGDGRQRRTFTYIEDLCRVLWGVGLDQRCGHDVYNVGGETLSIRDVARKIADVYGAEIVELPWPPESEKVESGDTIFNAEKLEDILGPFHKSTINAWLGRERKGEV